MSALPTTQPFRIGIAQPVLDDLRIRLQHSRHRRVLTKGSWEGGSDPDYLRLLLDYWRDEYDWRAREHELNELTQYVARIDDASVHYVHETGFGSRSTPLLMLHGWPDSFLRYRAAVAHLTGALRGEDQDPTFDVVVPSLPGFAFTGIVPPAAGVPSIASSARLLHRLMTEVLGYPRFMIAGGDGGSAIAQSMALQFPASVMAIHLTDIGWREPADPAALDDTERKYLEAARRRFMEDGAYVAVHAGEPRALAASLNDSPVGLASWIVDRFHSWADAPRQHEARIPRDELLTNITLYWVTQTIQSSIYGYLAETRMPSLKSGDYVSCPVGLALFPRDMAGPPPRRLAERSLNVVRWTEMPAGGHFGAWEYPAAYAAELSSFLVALEDMPAMQVPHGYPQRPSFRDSR